MNNVAQWKIEKQYMHYAGARAQANPLGNLIYVDSVNGADGNDGYLPRYAVKTLTQALTLAEANDTIVLCPGGSETSAAALEMNTDRVRVVCPADTPEQRFLLTISGDDNGLEIDAADCVVDGLAITHSGTTTSRAGIAVLGGDGSSSDESGRQAMIRRCLLNAAGTAGKTDIGVQLVGNCKDTVIEDCEFRGCKYGVQLDDHASDTDANLRPVVRGCRFLVGASAAFGVYSDASNAVQGFVIDGCEFYEADGDGSSATAAWDGTNGANATQGPIALSAACDQYLIKDCAAYTALATSFDNINAINGGAAGDILRSHTGEGGDIEDKVDTLTTSLSTVDGLHDVPSADSTDNAQVRDVAGNKTDAEVQAVATDKSIVAYVKGLVSGLHDNTAGIAAWPAAAAPANGVTIAEALRYIVENDFGTLANSGGTADLANIIGDPSNTDLVTRLAAITADTGDASADNLGALNLRQGSYGRKVIKTADCTAATPIDLFTVTGDVIVRVVGVVKADLTTSDAITAEVGVSGSTAAIIAQVADATGLVEHEIWHDATPDATLEALSVLSEQIVSNGQDIILTTTGTVTAGSIAFYCFWQPLSADGNVVAA